MSKVPGNVLVIFGAGASKGLLIPNQAVLDATYQPPVTSELFAGRPATHVHLKHYKGAERLANTVRRRLAAGDDLEEVLRELQDVNASPTREELLEFPLFLQELFGEISVNYVSTAGGYDVLVNALLTSNVGHVTFLTLNYDLFLETALGTQPLGGPIQTMERYVTNRWSIVKLHGSVNWARKVLHVEIEDPPDPNPNAHREAMLELLAREGLPPLGGKIIILPAWWRRFMKLPGGEVAPFYPELALPVRGKYKHRCPESHVEELRARILLATNVLVIGTRGRDADLLELLAALPALNQFVLVAENRKDAEDAYDEFKSSIPPPDHDPKLLGGGFQTFLTGRHLEEFIGNSG